MWLRRDSAEQLDQSTLHYSLLLGEGGGGWCFAAAAASRGAGGRVGGAGGQRCDGAGGAGEDLLSGASRHSPKFLARLDSSEKAPAADASRARSSAAMRAAPPAGYELRSILSIIQACYSGSSDSGRGQYGGAGAVVFQQQISLVFAVQTRKTDRRWCARRAGQNLASDLS